MKCCAFVIVFCGLAIGCGVCTHAVGGFLTAQSFPKTFQDASYQDRMAVLAAGYEPWESEYDAAGRCVRGCAYSGMTIEDEIKYLQRNTDAALQNLRKTGDLPEKTTQPQVMPSPVATNAPVAPGGTMWPADTFTGAVQQGTTPNADAIHIAQHVSCRPNNPDIVPNQDVPHGEPVVGKPRISSPFGVRVHPVTNKKHVHKGVDFVVPTGTDVFTPASGTVSEVWQDDSCGRGIKIQHARGYETVYCHLSQQVVQRGDNVAAGCRIGYSGNTGRSTGPHLHYGVKYSGEYMDPAGLIGR